MRALPADPGVGREDLVALTLARHDGAGRQQRGAMMHGPFDTILAQTFRNSLVAASFVDAPFRIDVHGADIVMPAKFGQGIRRVRPIIDSAELQRHA